MTMESRFRRTYFPNYFSLEDILATQERIPCKFEAVVQGLGFLDPSNEHQDLRAGTSVQLPLWIAKPLYQSRTRVVTIEVPKVYKEAYREILKADANIVDLRKMGLYFYELGSHFVKLQHREADEIHKMLVNAFRDRLRSIIDWAQNLCTDHSNVQRLDTLERELFQEGFRARTQLTLWLNKGSSKISASEMVVNHKKRKRDVLDV